MALAAVVASAALVVTPSGTVPVLAVAGTPQPPTVVFVEDFENGMTNTALGAKSYTTANGAAQYVGASGQTYTGSPQWINAERCNGVVLSYNNATAPAWASTPALTNKCSLAAGVQSYNGVRTLARAMGTVSGRGDNEHIVSSYTECQLATSTGNGGTCDVIGSGATNGVMFQTNQFIPVVPNRYYTFSVDTVYGNCASPASTTTQASDPQYQFQLIDAAGTATNAGGVLNGCRPSPDRQQVTVNRPAAVGSTTTMTAYFRSLRATAAFQYPGSTLGIKMFNASGVTNGNDGGFDNIRLLDVTPTLDKAFAPAVIVRGSVSTLTFTVTNTTDLLAKTDWNFTDALPAGLVVAPTPNIGGTCAQVAGAALTRTASPGSTSITVTGGDLAANQVSCTITVNVTAAADGTYTNGPTNVTTNLNPPTSTAVEVIKPSIDVTKSADSATYDAVNDTVTYTIVATNTTPRSATNTEQNTSLSNVVIAEDSFSGANAMNAMTCDKAAPVTLKSGEKLTCTVTYSIAQGDLDAPKLTNVARATGSPAAGPAVTDTDDEVLTPVVTPALLMDKSAAVEDVDQDGVTGLGDRIQYTFDVTNTGNVTVTAVTVHDDKLAALGIVVTCTPSTIAPMQVAHCAASAAYEITQADVDATEVVNTAFATGTSSHATEVTSNEDSTRTPTSAFRIPLEIEKIGESGEGTWVRMDGSSFQILTDEAGAPGTPASAQPASADTGLFRVDALPAGTYWLTELTAPTGFSLLAAPVQFTIKPDRTVAVLGGGGEAVSAAGQLITVRDVPAFTLPAAGGTGAMPFLIGGGGVIVLAALLIVRLRRRARVTPVSVRRSEHR